MQGDVFQNGDIGHAPIIMRPERLAAFQNHLNCTSPAFHALHRKWLASRSTAPINAGVDYRRCRRWSITRIDSYGDRDRQTSGSMLHEAWMLKTATDLAHHDAGYRRDLCGEKRRRASEETPGCRQGGFMLLFARRKIMSEFVWRFPGLLQVRFKFEAWASKSFYQEIS